jgi:hypothetical protein
MWADRFLKNTLQLKLWNSTELERVLKETSKIMSTVGTAVLLEDW